MALIIKNFSKKINIYPIIYKFRKFILTTNQYRNLKKNNNKIFKIRTQIHIQVESMYQSLVCPRMNQTQQFLGIKRMTRSKIFKLKMSSLTD